MNFKDWKVLIAFASGNQINPEFYKNDPFFSKKNYSFFNLGPDRVSSSEFDVVNSCDIPGYVRLGRKYAESELIYNVSKLNLFKEFSFLGMMHYDFNFYDRRTAETNITLMVDDLLKSGIEFISFFTGSLYHLVGPYNVLMDERKPNCLFVRDSGLKDPVSINGRIADDIERVLGRKIDYASMDLKEYVALCCSFVATREIFLEIGKLVVDAIDSGWMKKFDLEDRHRFPGQAIERYIAMYSLLYRKGCFILDHKFAGGNEDLMRNRNAENY